MTDILLVVDAQNGFCDQWCKESKRFVKTEKGWKEIRQTIACIKTLLETARARGTPIFYLCANESLLFTNLDYSVQIHPELVPHKGEEVIWRETPNKGDYGQSFENTLDFLKRFSCPRLFLCGFYSDKCVTSAALSALRIGYSVSFITDCVFPRFNKRKQQRFLGMQEYVSFEVNFSRVQFLPMSAVLPNANPPVPQ